MSKGARKRSDLVKRAAIARFFEKEQEEIDRMIREDALPFIKVPGPTKPGIRIYLPDFHRWLVGYAGGDSEAIRDYDQFLKSFWAVQEREPVSEG